MGENKRTVE